MDEKTDIPLTFRPTPEEAVFIKDHDISWSTFCHNALNRFINKETQHEKKDKTQQYSYHLLFLFIGIMFCATAYNTTTFLTWTAMFLTGSGIAIFGIFGIYQEVKTNAK